MSLPYKRGHASSLPYKAPSSAHKSLHTMSRCSCGRCVLGEVLAVLVIAVSFAAFCGGVIMVSRALGLFFRGM
jgi:hypothetical protein